MADPLESKQLQPQLWHVSTLPKGEVLDNVCSRHRLPQQEERDLWLLQAQNEQAAREHLVFEEVLPLSVLQWAKGDHLLYS